MGGMPSEITMPQLSDTMTEGTLVKWLKNVGDAVRAGEEVAEVETDKATMPMEAFEDGVLAVQVAQEGSKVAVGGMVGVVAVKGEDAAALKGQYAGGGGGAAAKPTAEAAAKKDATESAPTQAVATLPPDATVATLPYTLTPGTAADAAKASETNGQQGEQHGGGGDSRVKASPLAKRLAREKHVDVAQISGTGPGGRVVQKDVLAFVEQGGGAKKPEAKPAAQPHVEAKPEKPAPQLPARVGTGQTEKVELSKMRQTIAARLQQSKQQIPHFYEVVDVDMTEANRLRQRLLDVYEKSEGVRVSIGDVVAKGVAMALRQHPVLNSTFDGTGITRHGDVHLGMAVALPDGLIVPVLRNVDQMGVKEIRVRSADLIDRARKQRLKREEMSGATFTVSNLGTMGVREFSAIVNPPEVGILAVGASEERAVVRKGAVVARTMMTVTLSADHRAVDGADAARFLGTLKALLEEPALMLG